MKPILATLFFTSQLFFTQNIAQKLDTAVKNLMDTNSAYAANLSFYVSDANGNFVYEYNGNKGLSTASTQKIFTAAAALETLGSDYRYKTTAAFSGNISNSVLEGDLYLNSTGDPTLGSWRYDGYKPEDFKNQLISALKNKGIQSISGDLIIDDIYFDFQTIPGGWPWDDLGNYYGAGVWSVNWRENQFDMNVYGDQIKNFNINLPGVNWVTELETGGDSDQSLVFTAPYSDVALINGTLPKGKTTTVSGSTPNPPLTLGYELKEAFQNSGIDFKGRILTTSQQKIQGGRVSSFPKDNTFFTYYSPTLDKIVYWFMRKSVNLYGETLVKTMAMEKRNNGSFKEGIDYMKDFWKAKGINSYMINFADGSGLSPQNYVSARAEVQSLLWSKKQPWFNDFYSGFPTQGNGMKMKSGTMRNTKSFAGYQGGYVFSIIINNYQGWDVSNALYKVLNVLK